MSQSPTRSDLSSSSSSPSSRLTNPDALDRALHDTTRIKYTLSDTYPSPLPPPPPNTVPLLPLARSQASFLVRNVFFRLIKKNYCTCISHSQREKKMLMKRIIVFVARIINVRKTVNFSQLTYCMPISLS